MSATSEGVGSLPGAGAATPLGVPFTRRLRSLWFWIVAVLVLLVAAAVLSRGSATVGVVDPDNTHPDGGHALAQVLRANGVDVQVVRDADTLNRLATSTDAAHTTMVYLARPTSTSSAPVSLPTTFAHQVLGGLPSSTADAMNLPASSVSTSSNLPATRSCSADVGAATTLPGEGYTYAARDQPTFAGFRTCFGDAQRGWSLLQRGRLTLLADPDLWSNNLIAASDSDAAALALHLLGHDPHLVWYVPTPPPGPGLLRSSAPDLFPDVVDHLVRLLLVTAVVTMIWRGRRMGRLVREPLPAEVPALETTLNRARLYQAANEPSHALSVLQAATRRRLARRLGLASTAMSGADPRQREHDLVLAVSAALPPGTDAHPARVHQLLFDARCASNSQLVETAQALRTMEQALDPQKRMPS